MKSRGCRSGEVVLSGAQALPVEAAAKAVELGHKTQKNSMAAQMVKILFLIVSSPSFRPHFCGPTSGQET